MRLTKVCFISVKNYIKCETASGSDFSRLIFAVFILMSLFGQFIKISSAHPITLPPDQPPTMRQVLLLHSYHKGMTWADDITEGVEALLNPTDTSAELTVEYMDTKRIFDDTHYENLRQLYQHKFAPDTFDIIITADDNALDFILRYRDTLFPGVPVVFCGVNRYSEDRLQGQSDITGIVEKTEHLKTINLALQLHPQAQNVYVIVDRTTTGLTLREQLDAARIDLLRPVNLVYLDDVSIIDMEHQLEELSPTTDLVYVMTFHQDAEGRTFTTPEIMYLVAQSSNAPIYATGKEYLGLGIVGGYLNWGYNQGYVAAQLALRILEGENPNSIPVITQGASPAMFDYAQLRKWNIEESLLPEEAIIENRPRTFFQQYKILVIGTGTVFIVLIGIIAALVINIQQRHKAQQALRDKEAQYRLIVENQTDLVTKVDMDGRFEFVSPSYCELFHKTEKQLLGQIFTPQVHEQDQEASRQAISALKHPPYTSYIEHRILTQQGWRWLGWANKAVLDDDGHPVAIVSAGRDITERIEAASEIKRQNQRLALLYRVTTTAAASTNMIEVLEMLCEELAKALDLPQATATTLQADAHQAIVIAEYLRADHPSALGMVFATDASEAMQYLVEHKQPLYIANAQTDVRMGETRAHMRACGTVSMLIVPIVVRGRIISTLGLADTQSRAFTTEEMSMIQSAVAAAGQALESLELTQELKHYAEELEDRVEARTEALKVAMEQAQAADRTKSKFVSNVSHELRTPLTNIQLYTDLIQRGRKDKAKSYLETVRREAQRLQNLIEDLLNLSRLDLGKVKPKFKAVAVNKLVHTLAHDRRHLFAQHGLELKVEATPALPHPLAAPKLLEQVLTNLLTNALHYTESGTVCIRTAQASAPEQTWVTISVKDTGPGIAPEEKAQLFERFYRGSAGTKSNVPGTGLGLAISKEIMDLHHGQITVESQIGHGSTFTIWLPCNHPIQQER